MNNGMTTWIVDQSLLVSNLEDIKKTGKMLFESVTKDNMECPLQMAIGLPDGTHIVALIIEVTGKCLRVIELNQYDEAIKAGSRYIIRIKKFENKEKMMYHFNKTYKQLNNLK